MLSAGFVGLPASVNVRCISVATAPMGAMMNRRQSKDKDGGSTGKPKKIKVKSIGLQTILDVNCQKKRVRWPTKTGKVIFNLKPKRYNGFLPIKPFKDPSLYTDLSWIKDPLREVKLDLYHPETYIQPWKELQQQEKEAAARQCKLDAQNYSERMQMREKALNMLELLFPAHHRYLKYRSWYGFDNPIIGPTDTPPLPTYSAPYFYIPKPVVQVKKRFCRTKPLTYKERNIWKRLTPLMQQAELEKSQLRQRLENQMLELEETEHYDDEQTMMDQFTLRYLYQVHGTKRKPILKRLHQKLHRLTRCAWKGVRIKLGHLRKLERAQKLKALQNKEVDGKLRLQYMYDLRIKRKRLKPIVVIQRRLSKRLENLRIRKVLRGLVHHQITYGTNVRYSQTYKQHLLSLLKLPWDKIKENYPHLVKGMRDDPNELLEEANKDS